MAYEIDSQSIGFGPVAPRPVIRKNIEMFSNALNKIDTKAQEALKQRTAIDMALAQVDLNSDEDAWKANYAQNIHDEIDELAKGGDYSKTLNTAIKLSGEALSNPELLGRIRANADYKAAKEAVEKRNDISQVTKDRWNEQNRYFYQDKFDKDGRIIGGTKWSSNWTPVKNVDIGEIYGRVKQLVAADAGGSENAQFLDENGNLTSDPSQGFYGMAVKRGTKWERVSEAKLKETFDSLFKQYPEAMESLIQTMDDRHWEYNKATDKGKKAFIGSDIMDRQGRMYTPQEYLANKVNPVLKNMAYSHVYNSIDYGDAYAQFRKAKAKGSAMSELNALQDANNTTLTAPIELDVTEHAAKSYANVMDAYGQINQLWKGTNTLANKEYANLVHNRDYEGVANWLKSHITTKDPAKRQAALNAIRTLQDEGEMFSKFIEKQPKDVREAIEFKAAIKAGAPLPNAQYNRYTREYSNNFNNLFSYNPNPGMNGFTKPTNTIGIEFQKDGQLDAILKNAGLNRHKLQGTGLQIVKEDGDEVLKINKNSKYLTKLADAYYSTDDTKDGFWHWGNSVVHKYDEKGNRVKDQNYLKAAKVFKQFSTDTEESVFNKADKVTRQNGVFTITNTLQVKPNDDYNTQLVNRAYMNGLIDKKERDVLVRDFTANNLKAFGGAAANLTNYDVYARDDEKSPLRKLDNKTTIEAQQELLAALDSKSVELSPSEAPSGAGYGTIVRTKAKRDAKGEIVIPSKTYYIDGLFSGQASQSFASNPDIRAKHNLQRKSGIGIASRNFDGSKTTNFTNKGALINGRPVSVEYAIEVEKLNNILKDVKAQGIQISEKDAYDTATSLLNSSGLKPDSKEYHALRAKFTHAILDY